MGCFGIYPDGIGQFLTQFGMEIAQLVRLDIPKSQLGIVDVSNVQGLSLDEGRARPVDRNFQFLIGVGQRKRVSRSLQRCPVAHEFEEDSPAVECGNLYLDGR